MRRAIEYWERPQQLADMSDLGLRGEGRDVGKRVAWVGVAAWDVGHDWMLTSASVYLKSQFIKRCFRATTTPRMTSAKQAVS